MTAEQLRMSIINEAFTGDWESVSLGEICVHENGDRGKNYPSKDKLGHEGIPFISALNLANNTIIDDDKLFKASEVQFNNLRSGHLKKGDFVVCIRGSIGKHGIYPFEKGAIASSLVILRPDENKLSLMWLSYYFDSGLFQDSLSESQNGTAQPNLGAKELMKFELPLPPLAEQKRIVAKLEELLPIVEQYGKAQKELDELNAALPARLRQSILQEAISGRLVPQDPNDEPASVLLASIREEKARLVKEGKLKKKDLADIPITEEEIPFEIPASWEWVRLVDIGYFMSGQTPKSEELSSIGNIPYFKVSDMNVEGNELYMNNASLFLTGNAKYKIFPKNAIIYPKNGGALLTNKKRILVKDSLVDLNTGAYVPSNELNITYVYYLFSSIDFRKHHKGTALPTVDMNSINKLIFPLPPLAEQQRIVAKIEELFEQIDKITK